MGLHFLLLLALALARSDLVSVTSPSFTITDVSKVSGVSAPTSTSTSVSTQASYSVSFTTSSNGELITNDPVHVVLPSGMSGAGGDNLYEGSTQVINSCGGSTTLSCYANTTIPAGTTLRFVFNATNPATAGNYTLEIDTSSDPVTVTSPTFTIS